MKALTFIFTTSCIALILACGQSNTTSNSKIIPNDQGMTSVEQNDSGVLKIYVDNSGTISISEKAVTISELDKQMQILKSKNGVVYYSRDNATGEPPKESMQVMELVVKYSLPIKLFKDKSFTKPVDANGN